MREERPTEVTRADMDRMIRRMNELSRENQIGIKNLMGLVTNATKKTTSLEEQLSSIQKIDSAFYEMESRLEQREADLLDRLNKIENQTIETGEKSQKLNQEKAPK